VSAGEDAAAGPDAGRAEAAVHAPQGGRAGSGVYDRMAERYDELRRDDEGLAEQLEVTIEEGLGGATRLLDLGCGTGRFAAAASARLGLRVWGVDASRAMIARARERRLRGAGFRQARADALPFRDGWFDAVVARLVVHALGDERRAALGEAARVLEPGGRLFVWTFGREHFERFYLRPYLPRLVEIDLARFPMPDELAAELRSAGFAEVRERRLEQRHAVERRIAATRLRGGYISTVHLLPATEVEAAAAQLEQEAERGEPPLEAELRWRLLVATR
jgi:ubiquinone/menaquinone biosynthesis C-methylase UbiE